MERYSRNTQGVKRVAQRIPAIKPVRRLDDIFYCLIREIPNGEPFYARPLRSDD